MSQTFRSDLFSRCREAVPALEAARFYGLDIKHNHTACCPFHADDKPSLSFYRGSFRCFGCGAHGDSIDYVALYFGLKPADALAKLNRDFALGLPLDAEQTREDREAMREKAAQMKEERLFREWKEQKQNQLAMVYRVGHQALISGRELNDAEAWSVKQMAMIEYALDFFDDSAWRGWWEDDKRRTHAQKLVL